MVTLHLIFTNERRALVRGIMEEQTGKIIYRFSENAEERFAKFICECDTVQHAFELGHIIGRAEVFQKIQAE